MMSELDNAIREAREVREMLNKEGLDLSAIVYQCRFINKIADTIDYGFNYTLEHKYILGQLTDLKRAALRLLELID